MSRYEPLNQFLVAAPGGETPLSFQEVERILGRSLPQSARKHQAWWANTRSHSHATSWLDAGWKTERVDLGGGRVVFVKDRAQSPGSHGLPGKGEVLTIPLAGLTGAGLHLVDDHASRHGCTRAEALVAIVNETGGDRRRGILRKFQSQWTGKMGSDSVDLIREDRDAR